MNAKQLLVFAQKLCKTATMQRDEALMLLRKAGPTLSLRGVRHLYLFGSVARNEATDSSDIDLLVEFDQPVGIFGFLRIKRDLEEFLGRRVDLVERSSLRPALRDRIEAEALHAT
ncbi:MAG: nucleotidyltransferase family protein [Myxococcota bacterium]